jgi:hypothetical protein
MVGYLPTGCGFLSQALGHSGQFRAKNLKNSHHFAIFDVIFESLRVHSPRLAALAVIPARPRRMNSSRNPERQTGFRVKHGMTLDTPLLAAG